VTEEPWTPHAAGVRWLKPRRGHDQVAEFFEIVGAWSYERFDVLDILASDTQVAAEIRLIADLPTATESTRSSSTCGPSAKTTR
jgi:hypothetical protein